MAKRYFEDLADGQRLHCRPVPFTRAEIIDFARKFDPQPFHIDEEEAGASLFGGLIASSLHVLSACTRVVVEALGEVAILSGVGIDSVQMFNPVRPEDVLSVEALWTDLKASRSRTDRGYAAVHCRVVNQRGEPVIEYGYRYLLARRSQTGN